MVSFWKTVWIRSLADQAKNACSKENLRKELQQKFASGNGYPKNIVNTNIKRVLSKETKR